MFVSVPVTLWLLFSREDEEDGSEIRKFPIVEEVRELKHIKPR